MLRALMIVGVSLAAIVAFYLVLLLGAAWAMWDDS